jgi:arginine-tRNA-protein transferase
MANVNDFPFKSLQFYATAPYACSYLEGLEARSQVATPPQLIHAKIYSELIRVGFRRSGNFTYRPYCDHCQACLQSRIVVAEFVANRSQMRAQRRHSDLTTNIMPLQFIQEHFNLYHAYQQSRHASPLDQDGEHTLQDEESQYREFLIHSQIDSYLVEFREQGILKMVSVIDAVSDGLSSVYTFYDTQDPHSSYGTYGILWQIKTARELKLPYVYLGYYIQNSRKMSYKAKFKPLEALIRNTWQLLPQSSQMPPLDPESLA